MSKRLMTLLALASLTALPTLAFSQDAADVTMQVMERDGDPGEVARSLELPEAAADQAREATDRAGPADPARERARERRQLREERGDMDEAMREMRQERQRMREARDEMDRQRPENAGSGQMGPGPNRP